MARKRKRGAGDRGAARSGGARVPAIGPPDFCPNCSESLSTLDRFCPKCGTVLPGGEEE